MENLNQVEEQFCPLTMRLMEAVESPVENARKSHRNHLNNLLISLNTEMETALLKIRLSDAPIQRKILLKLKTEIINKLDSIAMSSDRRQYLLHQLAYAQDINELASLIQLINHKQIEQQGIIISFISDSASMKDILDNNRQDLILIAQTPQGIALTKQSFSLVAGVFADQVNKEDVLVLKNLANQENFLILNHELRVNESLLSALQSVELKGKDLSDSTVALTGTTGDLMTLVTDMIAGRVKKLILLHHSPVEVSLRYQKTIMTIISQILASPFDSELTTTIKLHWSKGMDLVDFLDLPVIKEVLEAKADLEALKEADIILCGNCPTAGFMSLEHFKKDAVIIDMTSTSAFDLEMKKGMSLMRSDLSYHMIFSPKKAVLS